MSIKVDYRTAIALVQRSLEEGRILQAKPELFTDDLLQWKLVARNYLRRIYGEHSSEESDVFQDKVARVSHTNPSPNQLQREMDRELAMNIAGLEAQMRTLRTYEALEPKDRRGSSDVVGNRIFLVHGHDMAVLHEVARFLGRMELEVTVLQEEPNRGQTIIEKFEHYGDVGFAVVLLTDDDLGKATGDSKLSLRPRARQNVIFELGYFIGRLGRAKVCALYQDGVELPSDYSGVLYIRIDREGGWKLKLCKELDAAGFEIDLNKVR